MLIAFNILTYDILSNYITLMEPFESDCKLAQGNKQLRKHVYLEK
jgi:hypothetical protein